MRIPLHQRLPDIRHKRFVRVKVDKKWRYYKNYNNAIRNINREVYEWLCVHEPGFAPTEVLRAMRVKAERVSD